jgi:PAS domain S-box-containing protein
MIESIEQPLTFLQQGGEMGKRMREKDWSQTAVGAPDTWPLSLRTAVSLLLNSRFPMFIWWGHELTTFYNDAYITIAGKKHPDLLGNSGSEGWVEVWNDIAPLVNSVFEGSSTWFEDQRLYIDRHGYIEETYFTFSHSPILDEAGKVAGVFCTCMETTDKVLAAQKILHNERNLRNTILQSPVAMSILRGSSFVVEIANDRMYELWGRGGDELLGRPIFEGLPEARHQGLEELLQQVYTTGKTFSASERPVQLPRGSSVETVYLNFVYEPLREMDGVISGVLVVGTDVTSQVVIRRKIEESEARTRMAASSANLGLYDLDLKDQHFIHSPRLLEIFGLDSDQQWPYKHFTDSILPEDLPIRAAAYEASKHTGELLFEVRIKRPDGDIRWIRLNGKYFWQGNEPRSLLGTVMDITEQKKAAELLEHKIEERTRELKQANEQLKQFTYAASHDLQEPLRKISFFLDKLLANMGDQLNDTNKRITERILHTTGRMRILIDDLLAYSNTTLGATGFTEVNLTSIVQDVLDDMEATIIEKAAVVHLQPLPHVQGDQRQLRQLFQNLISNALKYQQADISPRVDISAQEKKGEDLEAYLPLEKRSDTFYQIQVKDNGIGFAPDDAERIFQLFQRLHGKAEYEGTGVGLAIVQKVVDNHNGYIWADSEPGKGATFSVLLPVG